MNSKNNNTVFVRSTYVEKTYQSRDRFDSEAYWLAKFAAHSYDVPLILKSDVTELRHYIQRISGTSEDKLDFAQLKICIGILRKIYTDTSQLLPEGSKEIAEEYSAHLKEAITLHCAQTDVECSMERLDECIALLIQNFRITLFKDAKPGNWLFTQNGPVMIDFDYVRRSFFLADVAQLLNYSSHITTAQQTLLLDIFLEKESIPEETKGVLFKLARINSCIMAVKYGNHNQSPTIEHFSRTVSTYLKELGVTHA